MRIVLASSEAAPFSKTGGLADVASSLVKALDRAGHEAWLITPRYPQILEQLGMSDLPMGRVGEPLEIQIGAKTARGSLLQTSLEGSGANVLLVDQPEYYDRAGIYVHEGKDYKDNCERFVFFSRAVLEAVRMLDLRPDVLHLNDWQTGLVPALLQTEWREQGRLENTAAIFTIHNIAFQGEFWHWDMALTGLDWKYFNWRQMEFFQNLNLLKTGIAFADVITTVSPTYAREIQTPEFGCRLDGVLSGRSESLVGILNGVDTDVWNPKTDPHVPQNYGLDDFQTGKAACKQALQQRMGLPDDPSKPLVGMVSRITDQKGFDLIVEAGDWLGSQPMQMVFLGTGDPVFEQGLRDLAAKYPDRMAVHIDFDESLAHQIEAGSDIFLMPSQYEPCGLNQMYSLLYGTVPIVRRVGGLADTVTDATDENLAAGAATGFVFDLYEAKTMCECIARAIGMYADKSRWSQLVRTGMQQDLSWSRSAREYVEVYQQAQARLTVAASNN